MKSVANVFVDSCNSAQEGWLASHREMGQGRQLFVYFWIPP